MIYKSTEEIISEFLCGKEVMVIVRIGKNAHIIPKEEWEHIDSLHSQNR